MSQIQEARHKMFIHIDYSEIRYFSCIGNSECDHQHLVTWSAEAMCSCGFFRSHIPSPVGRWDYLSENLLKKYRKRAISIFRYHHKKDTGRKWDSLEVEEDKSQLPVGDEEHAKTVEG